ncbi:MAG: Spore germination protein gerPA/gerPF [Peptococcaceae bacterium]|nr:Spore germination protein gerPA/gerPF [Peptococcaceae bacterium]
MPGSLINFNIGFIKVNSMSGSSSFVVGDAVFPGTQSQTKNFTTGAFNTGDAAPINCPNIPFFNDPDVIDTSSPRQFTAT